MKNVKKNGGFTLVELIVVIAILAILAAVAIPAYSGYIAKAEKAGDLQLLGAINSAFAAACMAENIDISTLNTADAFIDIDDEGKVVLNTILPESARDDFELFYQGNEDTAFKVIDTLIFDANEHVFVDLESAPGGVVTISYGSGTIIVPIETAKKMQESSYGKTMGAAKLLGEMSGLTTMLTATDEITALLDDAQYMRSLAGYLNIAIPEGTLDEEVNGILMQALQGADETTMKNMLTGGVVYYAAENIQKNTAEELLEIMQSGDIYHKLEPNAANGGDESLRLAQSSMAYGLYAAFVNSDYNKNGAVSATDAPMSALQAISDSNNASYADFQAYIKSEQGEADMEAYLSAMTLINDSKGNNATVDALKNGFSDSELEALLGQVLGK